jgi:hypothetical protein
MEPRAELQGLVAEELKQPVMPAVAAMAAALRDRHPQGALGVLFYGSCLRKPDTLLADSLLDFYLLVEDYVGAYGSALLALGNKVLPPNVFYLEMPWNGATLRCKYAVLSLDDFTAGTARRTLNVSLWARFSQQARLVWVRDEAIAERVAAACSEAVLTMLGNAVPLLPREAGAEDIWRRAFQETYAAELRSEGVARATELVAADAERFRRVSGPSLALLRTESADAGRCAALWRRRRRVGKLLNLARLVKAAFTFDGGVDYVLWKVRRHSGVVIEATAWQRRHPLLAAPGLAWRLYRRGAFR